MRIGIAQQGTVFFLWLILPFFFFFPSCQVPNTISHYKVTSSAESFHQKPSQHHAECLANAAFKIWWQRSTASSTVTLPERWQILRISPLWSSLVSAMLHCLSALTTIRAAWLPTVNNMINTYQSLPASLLRASKMICVHRKYQDKITAAQKAQKQFTMQWEAEEGSLLEQYLSILLQLD